LGVDAIFANVNAAKIDFLTSSGAFCLFGIETMCWQYGEHFSNMYDMFWQGTTVNDNIIKVYDNEFEFHWLQDTFHHTHELAGCVRQAKPQNSPLVQP
jgi:hypothetical protein